MIKFLNYAKRLLGIPRGLTVQEIESVQAMVRAIQTEKFKLICLEKNQDSFPHKDRAKQLVEEQKSMVEVLENAKNEYIGKLFGRLGHPNGTQLSLDLATGKIRKV